jgi:hypothetical protein
LLNQVSRLKDFQHDCDGFVWHVVVYVFRTAWVIDEVGVLPLAIRSVRAEFVDANAPTLKPLPVHM